MTTICVQGRELSLADLDAIRQLRRDHPQWSRYRLSIELAQRWNWRNEAGQLKDMAARTLLRKLHTDGWIELPVRRQRPSPRRCAHAPQTGWLDLVPPPLEGALDGFQPLRLEPVDTPGQRRQVHQWLAQYHYRGYSGPVGENVQYLAQDNCGRDLAVMVFGAAAWKVAARDQFIGWSGVQRRAALRLIVNQQRFLILPWVRVPHLASHLLALTLQRLSGDWQRRYGHPVWLVETFVQEDRFGGTSYQAAGWRCVGQTTGRTRQDRDRTLAVPRKSIWVKPLHPRFREPLCRL